LTDRSTGDTVSGFVHNLQFAVSITGGAGCVVVDTYWKRLGLSVVLAFVALAAVAQAEEHTGKPLTGISTKFDGEFTVTYVRVHPSFVWDIVGSTEGWGEVDAGANFTPGAWFLQPMLGLDFSRNGSGTLEAGKLYAQLFAIYWKPAHLETHVVYGVPTGTDGERSLSLRQIATTPLTPALLLGGQWDYQSQTPVGRLHWTGPRLDVDVESSRISAAIQFARRGQSRLTLTYVTFF
jgi:hypothetical protein